MARLRNPFRIDGQIQNASVADLLEPAFDGLERTAEVDVLALYGLVSYEQSRALLRIAGHV